MPGRTVTSFARSEGRRLRPYGLLATFDQAEEPLLGLGDVVVVYPGLFATLWQASFMQPITIRSWRCLYQAIRDEKECTAGMNIGILGSEGSLRHESMGVPFLYGLFLIRLAGISLTVEVLILHIFFRALPTDTLYSSRPADCIWKRIFSRSSGDTIVRNTAPATPPAQNSATTGWLTNTRRWSAGPGGRGAMGRAREPKARR